MDYGWWLNPLRERNGGVMPFVIPITSVRFVVIERPSFTDIDTSLLFFDQTSNANVTNLVWC